MENISRRLQYGIFVTFSFLFFFIPLIFTTVNSELFEFNKIICLYFLTTVITSLWVGRMVVEKQIIFRPTPLDIPLILFFISQLISTIFSIDPHTSIFGYYSRFNGSLLSTICYLLLYWAFVSNVAIEQYSNQTIHKKLPHINLLNVSILSSAFLVSVYAIAQHYGIDDHIWVQDVKNRVFSTLGQPNWLAAYLVALIFLPFSLFTNSFAGLKSKKILAPVAYLLLAILMFAALLFTKSRSGLLAFGISSIIYIALLKLRLRLKLPSRNLFVLVTSFLLLVAYFGTPWSPSLEQKLFPQESPATPAPGYSDISPSTDIRKIVWSGALKLWQRYPVIGTGTETFAYSYPRVRPVEHNLLSEWDFVYNKAHNQYLNFAANNGTLGLGSYLLLIAAIGFTFVKLVKSDPLGIALFSGWSSILVTNFFGFSVVPVDLLFFLLPAVFLTLKSKPHALPTNLHPLSPKQKLFLIFLLVPSTYCLTSIVQYWLSDYHFATATKLSSSTQDLPDAYTAIFKSIKLTPSEPQYKDLLSVITADLAVAVSNDATASAEFKDLSLLAGNEIAASSPHNLSFLKTRARVLYTLAEIDPQYLPESIAVIKSTIDLAPTDPKLFYNLGLLQYRDGQVEEGIQNLEKALQLKPNYQDPLNALALIYEETGDSAKSKFYFDELSRVNPNHPAVSKPR